MSDCFGLRCGLVSLSVVALAACGSRATLSPDRGDASGAGGRVISDGGLSGQGGGIAGTDGGVAGTGGRDGGVAGTGGGVAGTGGGVAGTTGGIAGSSAGTGGPYGPECGAHEVLWSAMSAYAVGVASGPYEGAAVVERATTTELVLAFTPTEASGAAVPDAGAGDGGAPSAPLPVHVSIYGLGDDGRVFPVGAKVWLKKDPAVPELRAFSAPGPWSFAVFDAQGGRLLFGASHNGASPLPAVAGGTSCTTSYDDGCGKGKVTFGSVALAGTNVVLADGERRTVVVNGNDYDVAVRSLKIEITTFRGCADYFAIDGTDIAVRAKDLAARAVKLPLAITPTCARGNDVRPEVSFSRGGSLPANAYYGPITYLGAMGDLGRDCYLYSLDNLSDPVTKEGATLQFCRPSGFNEPVRGETIWLATPNYEVVVLRRSEIGPILIADVYTASSHNPGLISEALGVAVETRPGCAYARSPYPNMDTVRLTEHVFKTTPNVVLGPDQLGNVRIGAQDLRVWTSESGFTLMP